MTIETMVEFRTQRTATGMELPRKLPPGETVLMRVSQIMCLFPEHRQVRTVENGWTLTVFEEDWPKVEKAFRSAFLGGKVHSI
jgi:hypothetical protein